MESHQHSPHDNIDVRFQNRMSFSNSRVTIFFVPIILLGFFIFGSWVVKYPLAYIAALPWIVWTTLGLVATAAVFALLAFGAHFIFKPMMHVLLDAFSTFVDIRLKWHQRNYLDATPTAVTYLVDGQVTATPIVQERHVHQHKELPPAPGTFPPEASIPAFVHYEEIRDRIPHGHTLLGIGPGSKLETRPFSVLDTLWVCGGSKVGKTNTLTIKVEEGHQVGRKLLVCDPHKTKSDSLYHAINGYERDFLFPVAHTREDIQHAIIMFKTEAERRIAGGAYSDGWTLIVDEVGALTGVPGQRDEAQTDMYRLLAPVARMCGEQLRGYDMSGWFISQSPIGLSWLNSSMTVIVHKLLKENQQKLATNSNSAIMDGMTSWPRGRVFVYGLDLQGEYLLQQPLYTPERHLVMESLQLNPYHFHSTSTPLPHHGQLASNLSNGSNPEANGEALGSPFGPSEERDESPAKILRDIGKRLQQGESRAEIIKSFGLPYGRATQEMKAALDMIAEISEQTTNQEGETHGS